jgi:uncharacterized protein YPO0396
MDDGSVRKFFAIADLELTIANHFTQATRIADLKKHLKAIGVETFEEFIKYSQQFRKRLGLKSEKALDLFNQTVSIKEIGTLNDFVRNHMLEKTDVQTKIGDLQKSYADLTACHDAIKKAREQLDALVPLTQESERYAKLKKEVGDLERFQTVLPAFFASKKLTLLILDLQRIEQDLTQAQHQEKESDRILKDLDEQKEQLAIAISKDSVGQRLKELTQEITSLEKEVKNKQRQAEKYDDLAQSLNLSQYSDRKTFYANRTRGEEIKQEIETALQTLQFQRDNQIAIQRDLQKQETQLKDELTSLRSRKSQIPSKNLKIRDRLAHDLNLEDTNLPFIGELLQVRPEAQEWEGAIERLLRGFGLCVLVSETHYQAVNAYIHKTHLQGRLVYYRVTATIPNPTQRALDSSQVPYQLEIKQDNHLFSQWLRDRLVRQFNYVCCDTLEQFDRQTQTITRTGLIKHGGERHEKDDSSKISDRSQYILGWNNANKIKALEIELKSVQQKLTAVNQQVKLLEQQRQQQQNQISRLQNFMEFTDFSEIDWQFVQGDLRERQKNKAQLEASSDRLKQLETQLKTTKQNIAEVEKQRINQSIEIHNLQDRQHKAQQEQQECEIKLLTIAPSAIEEFGTQMATKLKHYKLTLDAIAQDEEKFRNDLQGELRERERQQQKSENLLVTTMLNFKNAFPETTSELGISLDYLNEYLKLKVQIEHDDLPRHEKQFKQLMTNKVIEAIVGFKTQLEITEEEIKENIKKLNEALQPINYTNSTYIKLCYKNSFNREIRDFKEDLKICLGDVARQSPEDNEERFKNIENLLIKRFQSEERWTNLVTDVRNWLDFSVSERDRLTNTEKEHHTDSSGKSGGQKVKLAYTILASAIAYQYGLNQDVIKEKSFRFVVIDEAFSKLDRHNIRYVMELFKKLNLQLLVITPENEINVIEPYISSIHRIHNKEPERNYSSIISISIEKWQEKRHIAPTQKHD